MSAIKSILLHYPALEAAGGLLVYLFYSYMWGQYSSELEDSVEKRQLGATVVVGQLTATIIAGTVIFGFLGAFAATVASDEVANETLKAHTLNAALLTLFSIACALWGLGAVSGRVARYDVTKRRRIAIVAVLALYSFGVAVVRFGFALHAVLYSGS